MIGIGNSQETEQVKAPKKRLFEKFNTFREEQNSKW